MSGKLIYEGESPKSQSFEAVKSLLAFIGRAVDPMPEFVELGRGDGRLVLVLSNKKDCYYVVSAKACSCPSATYRGGPCKHQRKYFSLRDDPLPEGRGSLIERGSFRPVVPEEAA